MLLRVLLTVSLGTLALAAPAQAQIAQVVDLADVPSSGAQLLRIHGYTGNGFRGTPIAGLADVDGDGFGDYGLSSFLADPFGRTDAGEAYLIFGDGTFNGSIDTAPLSSNVLKFAGATTLETAGNEIWMGEITGDAYADFIIGRQNYRASAPDRPGAGAISIVIGGPHLRAQAPLGVIDLANPPAGIDIVTIHGVATTDRLGIWMRVGDVTGDGVDDLLTAADQEDSVETHSGAAYLFRGGAHLNQPGTWDLADDAWTTFDGAIARIIPPGGSAHYHLGSTCQLGDLDGDGRQEVLLSAALNRAGAGVSADGAPGTAHSTGGSPDGSLFIAWDDGFPSGAFPSNWTIDLGDPAVVMTRIDGEARNRSFGEEMLAGLDYDGNGVQDLFVGDIVGDFTAQRISAGTGHVLYDAPLLKNRTMELDAPLPGIGVATIQGAAAGDLASDTVMHGDFDGDGAADLAICSPHADPEGRDNAGAIHVLHGQASPWPAFLDLAAPPPPSTVRITEIQGANGTVGGNSGDVLCYSGAAGDVDGDGRIDLLSNEMRGDGVDPGAVDVGNLVVLDGRLLLPVPIPVFPYAID